MPSPEQKIRILQSSQSCLVSGLLSLIPIVGLAFAVEAFRRALTVRSAGSEGWNPARPHLRWGLSLAAAGTVLTLLVLLFVGLAISDSL